LIELADGSKWSMTPVNQKKPRLGSPGKAYHRDKGRLSPSICVATATSTSWNEGDMAAWPRILVLTATIVSVAILLAIIYTA
jgi:hypothetical protein